MQNEKLTAIGNQIYDTRQLEIAFGTAQEAASLKLDDDSILTAFLMDSDITNPSIKKVILNAAGEKIAANIELLKRIGSISVNSKDKDVIALRRRFIELTDDIKIIIIKLAEQLTKLRFADISSGTDLLNRCSECLYFYSPIAQMLGIRKIYNEMEDISFKNLFPDDFKFLRKKISEKEEIYTAKIATMRNELLKLLAEHKIEAKIQWRIKRPYSVFRKIKNKKINLEEIYDLLALRVITRQNEDCYLTLGMVHSKWLPIEGRFRDWISYPKPNGYRSIQTTVHTRKGDKFEIQIRTEKMHEEAEFGSSAHWAYKQGSEASDTKWIQMLRSFLDNEEFFENPYEFFDSLKSEMKRSYINVLTPRGDIISLPEGSTPLDFAFEVHTELGYKTTGAKINGKFAKLKSELKSGDVIDVITNPNSAPSRDWLNIVKTSRARSKVLRWFKKTEREVYISHGKNSWDRLKEQNRKKIRNFEDDSVLRNNIAKLGYKTFDDFFFAIATGAVKPSLFLLKKLYPEAFKAAEKEKKEKIKSSVAMLPAIKIEGLTNIDAKFSRCCNPIKGEPILAYVTKKSEIKIHSVNCQLVKNSSLLKENIKKAEWLDKESVQQLKCKIFGDSFSEILPIVVTTSENESIRILETQKTTMKNKEGLFAEIELKNSSQFERFCSVLLASGKITSVKVV